VAQTAAAPPPAPIRQGPPIAGYCVFSINQVLGGSKVGQAVVARLKVLGSQVSAELQPEADSIRTDERALEAQQASLDAATLQAKRANLELRATNFEKREQLRQQEMQATQQKQFAVVLKELDPLMRDLYQQHGCSVLIDGDQGGVRLVNPAMDLSPQAVAGLDAKIQTLTFDREHLDQPGAAPAAAR
jgi:outer membrane protein